MAPVVRKIRKVEPSKGSDFDDQLWPINCAILILAGFVVGIVIATSDFGTERILYNGWARLISVAVLMGLLTWGVMLLQGKMVRRLQLCILISLLVHLWMAVYMHQRYLALVALDEAESARQVTALPDRIVPDYDFQQIDQPEQQQSFEEPIETEAPKPMEPEAIQHRAAEPEIPTTVDPPEEPEIPQRQQPNPAVNRRAELSAPRRADAAAGGQISRQEWKHGPHPNQPIPAEQIRPQARQAAAVPKAAIAPHQQRQTDVRIDQRQTFEDFSSSEARPIEVAMARRAARRDPIPLLRQYDVPTTPTPTRQVRRAAEIPRTEAAAPQPVRVARQSQQVEPMPRSVARRQADAPAIVRPAAQPTPEPTTPQPVAQAAAPQRPVQRPSQRAEARRPAPPRQVARLEVPTDRAAPQSTAIAAVRPPASVQPSPPTAQRVANGPTSQTPARVSQPTTDASVQPVAGAVATNSSRPVRRSAQPSTQPTTGQPRRVAPSQAAPAVAAARIEAAAASGSQAEASTDPGLPTIRARTTSVSRGADRSVRFTQDQPAGRALPAMTRLAQLPSALAARRERASQQGPAGTEATPARPSSLARSSRGAQVPSTAIATAVSPASTAAAAGGTLASRLKTAANAAVRHEAANSMPGSGRAVAGTADLAIGAGQIVARKGQPRAAGIGQPSATASAAVPRIARAAGPASSTAASGVAQATAAASGSVASTVSGPSTPSFNIRGSAARRGATVSQPATQTAVGSGPAGSSGNPGPVDVATANRVTRDESIEVGISGSGTPKPGRTSGGAASPSATAAISAVASGAPTGGIASQAPPLLAQLSGPRRRVSGLPGGIESQPASGALASLVDEGAPLARAVARRAAASPAQPGGRDLSAAESTTLRRDPRGTDLPSPAVPVESPAESGAGGVAVTDGGLPSTLAAGTSATVRQAAANVAIGQTTAAAGSSDSSRGSATAVAKAGRTRTGGEGVPVPTAAAAAPRIGRSPAAGPAIALVGPAAAQPESETVAGGPGTESGDATGSATGPETTAVARASVGVAAAQPGTVTGSPSGPDGRAIAATPSSRPSRGDRAAAAATDTVAGPARRTGAVQNPGTATAAAELAEVGPSTGGVEAGEPSPVQSDLAGPRRQMAGLPGDLTEAIAIAAATEAGPSAGTPGVTRGRRRLPQGEDEPGPSLAAEVGRGPLRRIDVAGLPRGVAEVTQQEPIASTAAAEPGEMIGVAEGTDTGEPSRREGGLPVQIAAVAGPGGLGYDLSPEVGLPSRLARPESEIIHTVSRRFVIRRSGGELAIDGRIREQPTDSFRQRDVGRRAEAAQAGGGSEGTERAVEMGLDYFVRHQFPDGHWSLHELPPGIEYDDPALGEMKADTAATGLALLTYLGAGYTHLDDKHRAVVNRGIDWLLRNQKDNGDLFSGGTKYAWFYSHGIATIALCEAYGMTRDPELREPARKAVAFILETQHPTKGGWRYFVDGSGVSTETDTSVSGWMLMALKSAQMAELEVPDESFEKIGDWLTTAKAPRSDVGRIGNPSYRGQYVYNPFAKDTTTQRHGRDPSLAMTAEAMLMQMYLGRGREDSGLIAGADHLKKNLPAIGTEADDSRDCYYWYYATQAMFQMQGDYWTAWNDRLHPLLQGGQTQTGEHAGSWHPQQPVRDKWGDAGGRHYATALRLLILEVYYRHLPLFQELSK